MDSARYDEVIRRLEGAGAGAPDGRIYHFCYGDRDRLQVIDVYDSPADLAAFGASLMPILQEMGVQAVPEPIEIYNFIDGSSANPLRL
jgi:hypothetical protein